MNPLYFPSANSDVLTMLGVPTLPTLIPHTGASCTTGRSTIVTGITLALIAFQGQRLHHVKQKSRSQLVYNYFFEFCYQYKFVNVVINFVFSKEEVVFNIPYGAKFDGIHR